METDRLILRFFEEEDEDFLFELNSDPVVMTYLTDGRPNTKMEIKDSMVKILKRRQYYQDQYGDFVGVSKKTGEPIGWFCLRPDQDFPDNKERIEIGWRLRAEFWHQGLATEAAQGLLSKAFQENRVPVVFARTMKSNIASQKVMQRLGMDQVREFQDHRFPGKNKTAVWYEIINKEK